MADQDKMKERHDAPEKSLVDKVIDLALGAGGGAVTLLSGLLAAVLILYSGYVLYDTFATERAASSNAWDLLQFKPEIFDDYETPLSGSELSDINRDYRCWLTVYGTAIDYPVVQGPNDTYYAAVDIYGRPSLTGAIYLAAGNSADLSDSYNVIYGHHMDSGAMFGGLDRMTGNETGVIIAPDAIYDVQFFARIDTDAYESRIYSVGNRKDDVLAFLRSGGAGGVGLGTEVRYFDEEAAADATKLVALSTCANANTSGRLVVIGKMTKRIVMKDVTVSKVWDDAENQDGLRPSSVIVVASDGTEATLTAEDNWTATVSVRKFDDLGEIQYTWTEKKRVEGYEMVSSVTKGDNTVITNRHIPAVTDLTIRKAWDDGGNRDALRTDAVTVRLSDGHTATLSAANNWSATFENLPVFADGQRIAYTWTEENVPAGYTPSYAANGDTTTLTNTHTPETVSLTVAKLWEDNADQDGLRPERLEVSLYGNGTLVGSVMLEESNNWSGTIPGLYVFEKGQRIAYEWREASVPGYTLTTATNGSETILTNTHVPLTRDLTVSKVWDDNNNQDGIRPHRLRVTLSNGRSVMLSDAEGWTATIPDMPVYAAGEPIAYSWTEDDVNGYELDGTVVNGDTTTLTNRHETDTTVATVTKVWEDDANRDGLRPASVIATLSNGQTVTLSEENGWTAIITGLPAYQNGERIVYTWAEQDVPAGYTATQQVSGSATELINTHAIETISLTVQKVWEDANNQDGIRPDEVAVTLLKDGEPLRSLTLDKASGWTATVPDLPVNEDGKAIDYTWTEENVPAGYTLHVNKENASSTILTNTHAPATTALTIRKVWEDDNNRDGLRPDSVTAKLSDGQTVTLSEANHWTATLENLPVYAGGKPIVYTWTEENVPEGYSFSTSPAPDNDLVTILTNAHEPATTSQTVQKIWDDGDNRDRLRPTTLRVRLLADGAVQQELTLNSVNGWSATVSDLPVNNGGQPIVYTWEEDAVEGYTAGSVTEGTVTTLTNRHVPAMLRLTVSKVWEDDSNRDGRRPESLTVKLFADEIERLELELSEANGWQRAIEVPVYSAGRAIRYEWKESGVAGYTSQVETDEESHITTFTNTHIPAVTERSIQKVWDDEENQDGVRPESLTVYLLADGEVAQEITLSEANGWRYDATDLPVFQNGKAISYSWDEEHLAAYPTRNKATNGTLTTFTNAHTPETTSLSVTKVWNDSENQDGIRPQRLEVALLANSTEVDRVTLSAANSWSATVEDLPVFAGGSRIVYTWDEGELEGYTLSAVTNGTATVLTNTHETEETVATIVKVWDDDDNRDGVRPESLTMTLSNGSEVTLNEANGWTATVENLPRYRGGQELAYTWTEPAIEGYTLTDTTLEGTVTTLTNHHDIATASRTVVKVWNDEDNLDGLRPASLTVTLNGNQRVTLNAANNWTATVEDQPIYVNGGRVIIYRWTEENVPGYALTTETEGTTTTLTNTHVPESLSRTVRKVWDDEENAAGIRPERLTVYLMNGTDLAGSVELSEANGWTGTVSGLPRYDGVEEIQYNWVEPTVNGYVQTSAVVEGDTTTLTNTITSIEDATEHTLTIRYRFLGGGEAAPTYQEHYMTGEHYNILSPEIPGYKASIIRVFGRMPGQDLEYTVIYVPDDVIIEEPETPLGLGQVFINIGDCLE